MEKVWFPKINDMISIIIPAYNADDYLANTVESVLNQTYPDFELLLIDDGSTDHTHEIVQSFQNRDNRIKYYYKPNGGVSSARNLGIEKAKGESFTFLDSDDTYEPAFWRKCIAGLNRRENYCVIADITNVQGEIS